MASISEEWAKIEMKRLTELAVHPSCLCEPFGLDTPLGTAFSRILQNHVEEFAAAFVKRTKLAPERIRMCVQPSLDGLMTIWFEEREEFDMTGKFYHKGRPAASESSAGAGQFLKVSEDDAVVIAPMVGLDELVSFDQHEFWDVNPAVIFPCIGDGCPGCELENTPKFKAFLPVLTRENEPKVYAFGISVERQLVELEEELGTIKGKALKIRRSGTGMKTKYMVVGLGKSIKIDSSIEIPDVIKIIGDPTRESIIKQLVDAGIADPSEFKRTHASEEEKPKPKRAAKRETKEEPADEAAEEATTEDDGWGSL